ncbi:TniQ family protein [Paenibacillus sp. CC-CFT747]|nr:TniQ family protein [Paenibacillus sp. CC-CFT747]
MGNKSMMLDNLNTTIEGTLYRRVEPIGIGTSQAESLGSYLHRLAQEHCLEAVELIRYILSDSQLKHVRNGESFYSQWTYVLNGPTRRLLLLPQLVALLEKATGRSDVHALSLSSWTDVLSLSHVHRERMSWCPYCIGEQLEKKLPIYEPLAWTFNAVPKCVIHKRDLVSACVKCGHQPRYFERGLVLGYCPKCHCSFSERKEEECRTTNEYDVTAGGTTCILELIAASQKVDSRPQATCIPKVVDTYRRLHCEDKGSELARRIGVGQAIIAEKYLTKHLISLPLGVQLAQFFGVPVHQLLDEKYLSPLVALIHASVKCQTKKVAMQSGDWDKERILGQLNKLLRANPPLSLNKVAEHVGQTRRRLSMNFPEHCRRLAERYQEYCIAEKGYYPGQHLIAHESPEQLKALRDELNELVATLNPPETLAMIAARIRRDRGRLRKLFPEICSTIDEKYQEYSNRVRKYKGRLKDYTFDQLEKIMNEKLEAGAVIQSTQKIATELGVKQRLIKSLFPSQYDSLMQRYKASEQEQKYRARQNKESQLRELILCLHFSGEYPSTTEIGRRLGSAFFFNKSMHQIWSDTLFELGYRNS